MKNNIYRLTAVLMSISVFLSCLNISRAEGIINSNDNTYEQDPQEITAESVASDYESSKDNIDEDTTTPESEKDAILVYIKNSSIKTPLVRYNPEDYVSLENYDLDLYKAKINEKYIEETRNYINRILLNYPEFIEDEYRSKIKKDDYVNIDLEAYIDEELVPSIELNNYTLMIGANIMPELENALIGLKKGDFTNILLTNTKVNENYGGTKVKFVVYINGIGTINYRTYDKLTNDYVQKYLKVQSSQDFIDFITPEVSEHTYSYIQRYITELLGKLCIRKPAPIFYLQRAKQYKDLVIKQEYDNSYEKFLAELKAENLSEYDYDLSVLSRFKSNLYYNFALSAISVKEDVFKEEDYEKWVAEKATNNEQNKDDFVKSFDTRFEDGNSYLKHQYIIKATEDLFYKDLPEITLAVNETGVIGNDKYIQYTIPDYPGFKTWMDYRTITSKSSYQYRLQQCAKTTYDGFRTVNGRYCIAIGTHFNAPVGTYVNLILQNGTEIPCIVGDIKSDRDTESNRIFTAASKCCSEFIIDKGSMNGNVILSGNVSKFNTSWDSPVKCIQIINTSVDFDQLKTNN